MRVTGSKIFHNDNESGGIVVIFTIFLTVMIPLLALTVDGYFMLQSRLDQQNVSEYFTLAALSGFNEFTPPDETNYSVRRTNAVNAVREISGSNTIFGLNNSSWDFNGQFECEGSRCSGSGWEMIFGYSDGTGFSEAVAMDGAPPDFIDTVYVNSIKLNLKLANSQSLGNSFNFGEDTQNRQQIKSNTIATTYKVGTKDRYKILKTYAGGTAMDDRGGNGRLEEE